jgi:hypothetical protein
LPKKIVTLKQLRVFEKPIFRSCGPVGRLTVACIEGKLFNTMRSGLSMMPPVKFRWLSLNKPRPLGHLFGEIFKKEGLPDSVYCRKDDRGVSGGMNMTDDEDSSNDCQIGC